MINRRSTPSGDGRGRGRTGGSGRSADRGGRPAFRSDDSGTRSSRDALRADRGGSRARYGRRDGEGESRFPSQDRQDRQDRYAGGERQERSERPRGDQDGYRADRRDDRGSGYGGERRDNRGGGYSADRRDDRGGYRAERRDDRGAQGGERRDNRGGGYGGERRDNRGGGYSADRRDDRGGYRAERRDDRGAQGGERRDNRGGGYGGERRDNRGGGYSADRRDDRGGYRAERRDDRGAQGGERRDNRGGGYGGERRDNRGGGYSADRREDRGSGYAGDRREDRGGYRSDRGEDRGGFRADRTGRRDTDRAGRGRDESAPRPASATRSRFGRRDGDARTDRAPRQAPRRDDVQTVGRSYGSPQHDRVKAARQPLRDRNFYPEGYTDERDTTEVPDGVRLQKVLAQAGVASRRACEEMIGDGRVTVNGQVVRRFGAKVDPATQVIHVDGKRIPTAPDLVYYALNKPIGVVSTMDDPQGRPCLADFVQELAPRLFHVGRLDTETEGLLLLTNDGELANRLTHPSYGVQKKYWAKVPGPIPRDLGRRLKQGIELEDGLARADGFSIVQEHGQQALVEIVLHEGRKHIVRRMLEEAGHRVIDLARIEFGPVKLGRTKPGTVRALSLKEVGELYAAVKL
ncbi:pseudouridine synthase [Nonomuraea sp. H19]|uniref:pseudouridine synthase n=1 Tax=Nonomuraea sp. H19 TaxID=3452206 RepID=UPI003F8884F3